MTDWKEIHSDFAEKDYYSGRTKQKEWEDLSLTAEQAKKWIEVGFQPKDYKKVKKWIKRKFAPDQVQEWINSGYEFVDASYCAYLRDLKNNDKEYKKYLAEVKKGTKLSEEVIKIKS